MQSPKHPNTKSRFHYWWWLSLLMLLLIIGLLLFIAHSRTFSVPGLFSEAQSQAKTEEARLRNEISELRRTLHALKLRCPDYPCSLEEAQPKTPPQVSTQESPSEDTAPEPSQADVPLAERKIIKPIVFILDTSRSMATPLSMPSDQARRVWERYMNQDPFAILQVEKWLNIPDPDRRMLHAKNLLLPLAKRVPADNAVGLIRFVDDCHRVLESLANSPSQKDVLFRQITDSRPIGTTPLALGISRAAAMIQRMGEEGVILIISDGDEACQGDPCAIAKKVHAKLPDVVINFVRMGGHSRQIECITNATGGRSFAADSHKELECAMLRAAGVLGKDEPCQ